MQFTEGYTAPKNGQMYTVAIVPMYKTKQTGKRPKATVMILGNQQELKGRPGLAQQ